MNDPIYDAARKLLIDAGWKQIQVFRVFELWKDPRTGKLHRLFGAWYKYFERRRAEDGSFKVWVKE